MEENINENNNLIKNDEKLAKNIKNNEKSGEKIDVMVENNGQNIPLPSNNPVPNTQNPVVNNPQISEARRLELLCELYNNTRAVDMIVQQLSNISPRFYGDLSRLNNENLLTQALYSWQYFTLSGMRPPRIRLALPILHNNFCSGLGVLNDYISQMVTRNQELGSGERTPAEILIAQGFLKEEEIINNLQNNC